MVLVFYKVHHGSLVTSILGLNQYFWVTPNRSLFNFSHYNNNPLGRKRSNRIEKGLKSTNVTKYKDFMLCVIGCLFIADRWGSGDIIIVMWNGDVEW